MGGEQYFCIPCFVNIICYSHYYYFSFSVLVDSFLSQTMCFFSFPTVLSPIPLGEVSKWAAVWCLAAGQVKPQTFSVLALDADCEQLCKMTAPKQLFLLIVQFLGLFLHFFSMKYLVCLPYNLQNRMRTEKFIEHLSFPFSSV